MQWLAEYRWLIANRSDGATVNYLGLPGADMLDVRYFAANTPENSDTRLRFLGFDAAASPGSPVNERLNISERELRDLDRIDKRSRVLSDEFKLLAERDSLAWSAANDFDYFDLVNLDLCGSLMSEEPDLSTSNYDAVHQLMAMQRYQKRPWSLLITTRIGVDKVHPAVRKRLWGLYSENRTKCAAFETAIQDQFEFAADSESSLDECTAQEYFNVLVTALAKWMTRYAVGIGARIELQSVTGYHVYGGATYLDMASLAFRFFPDATGALADPAGLSIRRQLDIDECEQAAALPIKVAEAVDIDELLSEDSDLRAEYVEASATLLEMAHYDRDEYMIWVEGLS
jgi:hypothetical protein